MENNLSKSLISLQLHYLNIIVKEIDKKEKQVGRLHLETETNDLNKKIIEKMNMEIILGCRKPTTTRHSQSL